MRWVKGLARAANPLGLEAIVMRMNRARFQSMRAKKRTLLAKDSARKRAARDNSSTTKSH